MKNWWLYAFICSHSAAAWAGNGIAVLDIRGNNLDENLLPTLTELMTAEIDNLGIYKVIAGRDVEAMLGFESKRIVMGCDDASCLAEIGGALGVDRIVNTQIGRVGAVYVVNIKVINIKRVDTEGRVYETVKGGDEALISTITRSVDRLLGHKSKTAKRVSAEANPATKGPDAEEPVAAASPSEVDSADDDPEYAEGEPAAGPTPGDETSSGSSSTNIAAVSPGPAAKSEVKKSGGGVPVLPIIVGVVGLGGIGTGVAFGVMAKDAESCAQSVGSCVGSQIAAGTAQSQSLIANVMFVAGGAAVAGAVLLFLLSGGDEEDAATASLTPVIAPNAFGLAYGRSF